MLENALSNRFVDVAHTIRRAIVNDEFVVEFLQAELVPHSVSLLRSLQSNGESVVNLRLHLQKFA